MYSGSIKNFIIALFILQCFLSISCDEDKVPTEQIEYATVTGIVHYRYLNELTLIEGAEVEIMDKVDTSDSKGKYTIEGIPYGKHVITCTHPDYDTFAIMVDISRDKYFFDINMGKSKFYISGLVFHDFYGPVEGAEVSLDGLFDTTDEIGYYEFYDVDTGVYTIQVQHDDYQPYAAEIEVYGGELVFNLELKRYDVAGQVFHYIDGAIAGAEISLDGLLDTTDENGEYEFLNIDSGKYIIECNHPGYDPYSANIETVNGLLVHNIELSRPMPDVDTLWIEEDASISYSNEFPEWEESNFGDLGYVEARIGYTADIVPQYFYKIRILLKLPEPTSPPGATILDSAFLVLQPFVTWAPSGYCCANVRRILDFWHEDTVTWNNQPAVSDVQESMSFPDMAPLVIDVTDNYSGVFEEHYGLRITYSLEEGNYYYYTADFVYFSSECGTPSLRPYVELYYTR